MKRSDPVAWRTCWSVIIAGVAIFSSSVRADPASQKQAPATAITILDQNGRLVPNGQPSSTSQIFDVTVGPGGQTVFSPDTLTIAVGDTVRWTWASIGHSVTSGNACAIDSQFCSPDDMNCALGVLSNTGTVYQHTFAQAGTYTYFCVAHCSRGMTGTINVAPACTPPPANMTAWWPGDGNTRDIQGGNNGILQGGATFAAGEVGQAFNLNGTDGFVEVHNAANVSFQPNDPITVDTWVYRTGGASVFHILGKRTDCAAFNYQMAMDPANGLQFSGSTGGGVFTGQQLAMNQWVHLAATFDGSTFRFYINGILAGTGSGTLGPPNSAPFRIGRSGTCEVFPGLIDEVEVFNRALTAQEVTNIFNAGAAGKCKPPQPTAALSRKTHGGAGIFDIDLVPDGIPGIECRSGGVSNVYQMIAQFANPVTVAGATLLTGSGSVSGFSVAGAVVTIDLSNIANVQTIVVKLTGVNDGTLTGDVPVAMSVLVGDTNGNGSVSASDIGQTKGQSGQTTTGSNFRTDVNASGSISAGDVGLVKSKSGTSLPP